jgi:hypothetical protein
VAIKRLEHLEWALSRFGDAFNCEEHYPGCGGPLIDEGVAAIEEILAEYGPGDEPLPGLRKAFTENRDAFVQGGSDEFLRRARAILAQRAKRKGEA